MEQRSCAIFISCIAIAFITGFIISAITFSPDKYTTKISDLEAQLSELHKSTHAQIESLQSQLINTNQQNQILRKKNEMLSFDLKLSEETITKLSQAKKEQPVVSPPSLFSSKAEQDDTGRSSTIESVLRKALGSSNRDKPKVYQIEDTGKNLKIIFTIDNNLTNGMIKSGAKIDITKILEALQSSKYNYSEVTIWGTYELVDKYGNSQEEYVLKVSYTPATVNRVNWDNFLFDNIYDIADSVWLHPVFRDE